MLILEQISNLCTDPGLANIIAIIKKGVSILWIFGPILAIISGMIIGAKLMSNPEEKKYRSLFKNCVIALIFLFVVSILVNAAMALFDDNFEVAACWNQAEAINSNGEPTKYINKYDKKKSDGVLPNPDDYKTGTKKDDSDNNTNSNGDTHVSSKTKIEYNLYNQSDSKWADKKYDSGQTIEQNGCMITSVAVVASASNEYITPLTVFNSKHRHNYPRNSVNALAVGNFICRSGSTAKSSITSALNSGEVVIILVYGKNKNGSSLFTTSQHYMALIDYDGSKIFVGNAFSSSGYGKSGWYKTSEVLKSIQTADYCTPSDGLKAKFN